MCLQGQGRGGTWRRVSQSGGGSERGSPERTHLDPVPSQVRNARNGVLIVRRPLQMMELGPPEGLPAPTLRSHTPRVPIQRLHGTREFASLTSSQV